MLILNNFGQKNAGLKILFIGTPGAGKTSQAEIIAKKLNITHIDGSKIWLEAISEGKSRISSKIVYEKIIENSKNGFILSGFPKTVAQAKALDKLLSLNKTNFDKVLLLQLSREDAVKRMKLRNKEGENSRKRVRKFKNYSVQEPKLIEFYKEKGLLEVFVPTANKKNVFNRLFKLAKKIRKTKPPKTKSSKKGFFFKK